MDLAHLLGWPHYRVHRPFVLLLKLVVIFHLFTASEFLKHNHLIAPVLWTLGEEGFFLFILRRIDDVRPLLLVLRLKVAKEFVERLVALGHRADRRVERFALRLLACFHECLKLFNLCDSLWSTGCLFAARVFSISKEKHTVLVMLVLVAV